MGSGPARKKSRVARQESRDKVVILKEVGKERKHLTESGVFLSGPRVLESIDAAPLHKRTIDPTLRRLRGPESGVEGSI